MEQQIIDAKANAADIQSQKNEWRRKGWAIPDFRGSKQEWFAVAQELIKLVSENQANDLDAVPQLNSTSNPQTWRTYTGFLKGIGLVSNQAGMLRLSKEGENFCTNSTKRCLAELLQEKVRLLDIISLVIAKFREERDLLGDLSPRDLLLLLRHTNISPSLEELVTVMGILSTPEVGFLQVKGSAKLPENTVYSLVGERGNAHRLRALASAIDKGLGE